MVALQALASANMNGIVPMSPALSHHQSSIAAPTALQQTPPVPPLQTPLVQNFLSSLDLCALGNVGGSNSNVGGVVNSIPVESNISVSTDDLSGMNVGGNMGAFQRQQSSGYEKRKTSYCTESIPSTAMGSFTIPQSTSCASSSSQDQQSTIAAVIAEVASAGTGTTKKPPRNRTSRITGSKRLSQSIKQPEDPVKQEEIERQIKACFIFN